MQDEENDIWCAGADAGPCARACHGAANAAGLLSLWSVLRTPWLAQATAAAYVAQATARVGPVLRATPAATASAGLSLLVRDGGTRQDTCVREQRL